MERLQLSSQNCGVGFRCWTMAQGPLKSVSCGRRTLFIGAVNFLNVTADLKDANDENRNVFGTTCEKKLLKNFLPYKNEVDGRYKIIHGLPNKRLIAALEADCSNYSKLVVKSVN